MLEKEIPASQAGQLKRKFQQDLQDEAVQKFAEKLRLHRVSDGAAVGQPMPSRSFALTP